MRSLKIWVTGALTTSVLTAALLLSPPLAAASAPTLWNIDSIAAPSTFQTADGTSAAQELTVSGVDGAFTLSFEGQSTGSLPFGASATEVSSALNALSTIGGRGGSVTVTGGSGKSYVVSFEGTLRGVAVAPLGVATAPAAGQALACQGGPASAEKLSYQWLEDGLPITAATGSTYTLSAGDAGRTIQCETLASNSNAASLQVSPPAPLVPPPPAAAPPSPPPSIAAPTGTAYTKEKIKCEPGTWEGAPAFSYQWYASGVALSGDGANTSEYEVQNATAAAYQCAVTGTNAGGAVTKVSETKNSLIAPSPAAPVASASIAPLATVTSTSKGVAGDEYFLAIANVGDTASSGKITVTDKLPEGVTTTGTPRGAKSGVTCLPAGAGQKEVTCTTETSFLAEVNNSYHTTSQQENNSNNVLRITIPVTVSSETSGAATNTVTVSGGGAPSTVTRSVENPVNEFPPSAFGISYFNASVYGEDGEPFTQAGGHPYGLTVNFGFDTESRPGINVSEVNEEVSGTGVRETSEEDAPREIITDLPLGLVGNPLAAPRCSLDKVAKGGIDSTACPHDTQVGVINVELQLPGGSGPAYPGAYALFNVTPEPGHPGEFAFGPIGGLVQTLYGAVVRTPYGSVVQVITHVPDIEVPNVSITFFGQPGALFAPSEYQKEMQGREVPFLETPTQCGAPEAERTMTMYVDSWKHTGALNPDGTPDFSEPNWRQKSAVLPGMEGCGSLYFNPSRFELAPQGLLEAGGVTSGGGTTQADEPSAFEGHLEIPQVESFTELSRPELKNATITLPTGLSVSPSAAGGLEGCSEAQLDPESGVAGNCPEGSQLGTVEVESPLLEKPLDGHVYLAEPKCGEEAEPACAESEAEEGKLFGLDMELDGEAVVKLAGKVEAGGYGTYSKEHGLAPGQLRAVFDDDPQLPFEELVFHFKEGERTPLANPQSCGTFTTTSVLEPWSAPFSESAVSQSPFSVSWDGKGGACPSVLPFAPGFTAGTQSQAAGAFSPFVVRFERQDREQDLSGVTVHTPAGVLADLAGVPLCSNAQANAGTCSKESEIGTTTAVVGPGSDPFTITGGHVYLTESYGGGSFGLSVVVPANAGPFHLGNVVVRASIAVNPSTAALTITSNPLPQVVDSVPIRLRTVEVDVNRPAFMFNATSCTQQKVEATLTGLNGYNASSGSSANVSSSYAASGCKNLKFTPKFSVSTSGKTSKADGASLTATLSEPNGSQGSQANVAKVKVELPKQLPSRLTTLQKACTDAQFESNPADCPSESKIGYAVVHTPLLPVPLEGPAIFVSHGGEAFPSLTLVLQGDGVTIDLVGTTYISKAGVTSTTFKTVPDAPFSTFTLTLAEGPYSALAANGNLCTSKLTMPTEFVAQNGAEIHETTPVTADGCSTSLSFTHKIKKKTLTLSVYAPAAGKITASAKGLTTKTKTAKGHEDLTITLKQKKAGKLKTTVKVVFTPSTGKDRKKQTKSAKLTFKK